MRLADSTTSTPLHFTLPMQELLHWFQHLSVVIESGAVLAGALSGLLAAAHKRLDLVGVFTVAFLTAFGGGTLRDLLLDQRPFFWVEHQHWLWVLLILCLLAVLFMRQRHFAPKIGRASCRERV